MADIPLRTYVSQLDNLIERKQVDEVIAHCRHILSLYPKHLDTYRLLGKALLEKGRHGDAADIFERVLSVIPDDFISHVGMSIVREDEANLEAALWHMERAFEAAPSNGAIQQELCRLYGRRDGVVPSKARLTRGALARMYTQGGLYLQAEAELKAALTDEPERIDLLTTLAQVYWQTDQPAQAAQTSAAVLQKLPYSLEANRILLSVFREQGRPDDAAVYRQRLEAVDPYQAFADPAANGAGSKRVDPAKVQVSRLDYVTGMEDSGSPDWLASIGARFEDQAAPQDSEAQPDWLTAAASAPAHQPPVGIQSGSSEVPDWLKGLDPTGAEASAAPDEQSRDQLTDISHGNESLHPDEGPTVEAVPDWLKSGTGTLAAQWSGRDNVDTGPIPEGALPDWMLPEPATSSTPRAAGVSQPAEWSKTAPLDVSAMGSDELPSWLKAIAAQPMPDLPPAPAATAATPPIIPVTPEEPAAMAPAEVPAWLQAAAPVSSLADEEIPEWLKDASGPGGDPNALPDWLRVATGELDPSKVDRFEADRQARLAAEAQQTSVAPPASLAPPASVAQPPEPPASEAPLPEPEAAGEGPAWMTVLAGGVTALADLAHAEPAVESTPEAPHAEPATGAGEAAPEPDWMSVDITGRDVPPAPDWFAPQVQPVPAASESEPQPAGELPDWLSEVGLAAPTPNGGDLTDITKSAMAEPGSAPIDQPVLELPAFLKPASPEAIARAEQPYDFQTDEDIMADSDDDSEMPLPAEIPDWLKALAPVSPDPVLPEARQSAPDEAAEAPAEAAPAPSVEDGLTWLAELKAQAAANTAAAGGAEMPDWLASAAAEPAASELDEAPAGSLPPWAEPHEPGPSDTIASWLSRKRTDDAAVPPAAVELPAPTPAEMPAPMEPAEASLEPAADIGSMDSDEAFRWLEGLAARQGASPDELLGEAATPEASAEVPAPAEPAAPMAANAMTAEAPAEPATGFAGLPDWLRPGAASELEPDMLTEAFSETAGAAESETAGYASLPDWLRPGATAEPAASLAAEPEPEPPAAETAFSAGYDSLPDWLRPGADIEAAQSAAAETTDAAPAAEPAALPDWLREMEAAMPVEPLVDTAPSKGLHAAVSEPDQPAEAPPMAEPAAMEAMEPELAAATPEAIEPMPAETAAEPEMLAQPEAAAFDEDAAMRWLEGLAAQQGASADELFTQPEERPLSPPSWITAEQMRAMETAEPVMPAEPEAAPERDELGAMDADAALRWLESLNARSETAAEASLPADAAEVPAEAAERPAEVAAWFAEAAPEAEMTAPESEPEAETTVPAEPPEWLQAYAPAEPAAGPTAELPAEAAAPEPPPAAIPQVDDDRLARLAQRLSVTRGLREQDAEARFAEQRERDEAARREVQERMEARWAAEAAEAAKAAAPAAVRAVTGPIAEPPAAEAPPPEMPAPEVAAPEMPAQEVPAPAPALSSEALTEILVTWTERVESGRDLPEVIREMENVAPVDTAPVAVVQLLGDAYVRANQLQKALDTYRQALRRL